MAKVSTYPRETNPAYNDLLYLVHDPSSPLSKTVEIANLSKALGWVDVRAYGAKGDGVTDDTVAIQEAIDFAGTSGGGTVLLCRGSNYLISSGLTMDADDVNLFGNSATISTSSDIDILTVSARRCSVFDLHLEQDNPTPTKSCLLLTDGAKICSIRRVRCYDSYYGIKLASSTIIGVAYNYIGEFYCWGMIGADIYINVSGVDGWVDENNFFSFYILSKAPNQVLIENNSLGGHEPNNNKFIGGSFEAVGVSSPDFAVRDYGTNVFISNRVETEGFGFYFENLTSNISSSSRSFQNFFANDKSINNVITKGRLATDVYFNSYLNGFVLGEGFTATTVNGDSASGQKVLNVADTTPFSVKMPILINEGGPREEWVEIETIQAGVSLTLWSDLVYTHTALQADSVQAFGKVYGTLQYYPTGNYCTVFVDGVSVMQWEPTYGNSFYAIGNYIQFGQYSRILRPGHNIGSGISYSDAGTTLMYNANWNSDTSRWETIAAGRASALSVVEGQLFLSRSETLATGAGEEITWVHDTFVSNKCNLGIGFTAFDASAEKALFIGTGNPPANHVDDSIAIYSVDSSDATATLGLRTEQLVEEVGGGFTTSHKLKILVNGTEYWIPLDSVV